MILIKTSLDYCHKLQENKSMSEVRNGMEILKNERDELNSKLNNLQENVKKAMKGNSKIVE